MTHVDFEREVERPRVLRKEEILALTDRAELRALLADYEDGALVIETMLEYEDDPRDPEWFGRARGALIVHRLGVARVKRRIKELSDEANALRHPPKVREPA